MVLSTFEDIEEKFIVGDLNSKLNYSYMLLCTLSHELVTPINHLSNSAEKALCFCRSFHKDSNCADVANNVELEEEIVLSRAISKGMLIFVQNIMDFARSITKSFTITSAKFSLSKAIASISELFVLKAHKKGLRLEINCDSKVYLQSDRDKLVGLLYVFLDNAIKYTREGGIKLNVSQGRTSNHITFEIIDSGNGISQEDIAKLGLIIENPFINLQMTGAAGIGIGYRVAQILLFYLSGGDMEITVSSVKTVGTSIKFDVLKKAKEIDSEILLEYFYKDIQKVESRNCQSRVKFENERAQFRDHNIDKGSRKTKIPTVSRQPCRGTEIESKDFREFEEVVLDLESDEPNLNRYHASSIIQEEELERCESPSFKPSRDNEGFHNIPMVQSCPMLFKNVNQSRNKDMVVLSVKARGTPIGTISHTRRRTMYTYTNINSTQGLGEYSSKTFTQSKPNLRMTSESNQEKGSIQKVALVVDDEVLNSDYLQMHLEEFDIEVFTADDGDMAVELCSKLLTMNKKIDIIFMDYSMPNMNGDICTSTLRESKFDPVLKNTPIVGVSAHRDPDTKKKCLLAGMDLFEYKPFSFDSIQAILQKFSIIKREEEEEEENT